MKTPLTYSSNVVEYFRNEILPQYLKGQRNLEQLVDRIWEQMEEMDTEPDKKSYLQKVLEDIDECLLVAKYEKIIKGQEVPPCLKEGKSYVSKLADQFGNLAR